jgi:hypothetical protein
MSRRLIDPKQAYEIARLGYSDFAMSLADLTSLREVLEDCDTIDAVEVVRCKHCQHQKTCEHTRRLGINGWCSDGERKTT